MTTQEQYATGFTRQKQNDIQKKAVSNYLEEHREINRDYAYDIGLLACGRIKNIGGRIHELRKEGWSINTTIRNGVCWYVLIAKPQAETLALL
jgi:septal ring-binding cell division protein DamX